MKFISWLMLAAITLLAMLIAVQGQVVTTVAGGGSAGGKARGHDDGKGVLATLGLVYAMTCDGKDLCYIGERTNGLIRTMHTATYQVTTVAGGGSVGGTDRGFNDDSGVTATFTAIRALTISGNYLYIADSNRIRTMNLTSYKVTTIAGGTTAGNKDGIGTDAQFSIGIYALAISGNKLYIGDAFFIRMMDITTNQVTTVAGGVPSFADGIGTAALMRSTLRGFCIWRNFLYFADTDNSRIRRMDLTTYQVTTLAGGSVEVQRMNDGPGINATFYSPSSMSILENTLYIADTGDNVIRTMDLTTNEVKTYAGGGSVGGFQMGFVDGTGAAAKFNAPTATAISAAGLYVADSYNYVIRLVSVTLTADPTTTPAVNATVVIPLPAGADLSPSDLQALYSALVADAGSSLSVSMTVAYDATTNLPYIVIVVSKTGPGSLNSALEATSFSSAKAVLQQKGVPFSQVALCVACTDNTLCNPSATQSTCRASLTSGAAAGGCSDGCIAALVVGLFVSCCVASLAVFCRRQQKKGKEGAASQPDVP